MFSCKTIVFVFASLLASQATPVRRQVPQEHSHEATVRAVRTLLNLNNPDGIVDPVFGLLGNAAAANGLGQISDPDCLQQATADQAFTNAKAANDAQGQVDALIFRALERNTGKVGQASVACTAIQAVNPEIAALAQHQDAASPNAAAVNKEIVLELARQIASVGGNPLDALQSGTFAPGDVNDPTAKGNSCNDENDAQGCIISQNLLVADATEAEIEAAVNGAGNGNNDDNNNEDDNADTGNDNNAGNGGDNAAAECPTPVTVTVQPPAASSTASVEAPAASAAPSAGAGTGEGNGKGKKNKSKLRGSRFRAAGLRAGGRRQ